MGASESSNKSEVPIPNWNPKARLLLYVDNSNIYHSTQGHAGRAQNFPAGISDVTCRMHLHSLIDGVADGRNVLVRNCYGVMSPEVSVMLQKKGIKVINSFRSSQGREKEADTQLTAHAVEDIILNKPAQGIDNPNGDAVVIFSGDQDMCPIIKMARKYGWNVEVWAYTESLAEAIKTEQKQATGMTSVNIIPLENWFDKFTYFDYKDYTKEIPKERSLKVVLKGGVKFMQGMDDDKKASIKQTIIQSAKKTFNLPVAIKLLDQQSEDTEWALIITLPETDKNKTSQRYNFMTDVLCRRKAFAILIEDFLTRNFGGEKKVVVEHMAPSPHSKSKAPHNGQNRRASPSAAGPVLVNPRAESLNDRKYPGPKAEYCFSTRGSSSKPCKYPPGKCMFAHSKEEIFCYNCNTKGHATSKCRTGPSKY